MLLSPPVIYIYMLKVGVRYNCVYSAYTLLYITYMHIYIYIYLLNICVYNIKICLTSQDGQMSRAPASRSGRVRNLKVMGSNLDLAVFFNPGRVKTMTLKLIRVAHKPGAWHH